MTEPPHAGAGWWRAGRVACGTGLTLALAFALAFGAAAAQTLPAPTVPAPTVPALTAAQQTSLDRALQLWREAIGGSPSAARQPASVTPEGDHYRVRIPVAAGMSTDKQAVQGGALSATARPLQGGRWEFDHLAELPLSMTFPVPQVSGVATLHLTPFDQDGHALIDPSLATPSSFESSAGGLAATFELPPHVAGLFRTGPFHSDARWTPAGPGRIDRTGSLSLADIHADLTAASTRVDISLGSFSTALSMRNLSLDRLAALRQEMREANRWSPAGAAGAMARGLTDSDRALLRDLLGTMRDVAAAESAQMTLSELEIAAGGRRFRVALLEDGFGFAVAHDTLAGSLRLQLNGFGPIDAVGAPLPTLWPRRLLLEQHVSGVSCAAWLRLADDALAVPAPSTQALRSAADALLARQPLDLDLDRLTFTVGGVSFAATGAMHVAGTTSRAVTGSATVRVADFATLLARAGREPSLRRAAPALIFLKGLGQEEAGGDTVWTLAYADGRALVNGIDVAALLLRAHRAARHGVTTPQVLPD